MIHDRTSAQPQVSLSLFCSNSLKFKPQDRLLCVQSLQSRGQLQYTWAQFSHQRICESRMDEKVYNLRSKNIFNFIGLQKKYSSRDQIPLQNVNLFHFRQFSFHICQKNVHVCCSSYCKYIQVSSCLSFAGKLCLYA
jgi:hypothetical protein